MPLVIKTKKKQFFAEYDGNCLMGFELCFLLTPVLLFMHDSSNFCNILIVKPLKYSEIKLIFDFDQNTFGLHLLYKLYTIYILDTFYSASSVTGKMVMCLILSCFFSHMGRYM